MKLSECFSNSLLDIGKADVYILLLLGDTDGLSLVASGLGVLTSGTETPVVTEATVGPDLLEPLKILTELVVKDVGHDLGGLAVLGVALPVEEPVRDLVLTGILDDGDQPLDLLLAQLSSPPVQGNVSLLQADVGVTTSDSLDGGHGEHDARLSVDVGVENTKNVLEIGWDHQRHLQTSLSSISCRSESSNIS